MASSDPSPPPPAPAPTPFSWDRIQVVVGALAGVAGLGVYIYLLGGIVAWLRAVAARLPADNVTPAFEDRHLVVLGLKVVALEVLLFAAVALAIFAVLAVIRETERTARHRGGPAQVQRHFDRPTGDEDRDLPFALTIAFRSLLIGLLLAALGNSTDAFDEATWLGLAILFAAAAAALELALRWRTTLLVPIETRPPSGQRFLAECLARLAALLLVAETVILGVRHFALPLGTAVLVLLGLLVLVHYAHTLRTVTAVVVVVVALNVTVVAYLATPPVAYERATIKTTANATLEGAYLGRTSNGVYLGICTPWHNNVKSKVSEGARVRIVAPGEIEKLTLGGSRYVFDVGTRPTIFQLASWFLTGENAGDRTKTALLDLRLRRRTCVWDTTP